MATHNLARARAGWTLPSEVGACNRNKEKAEAKLTELLHEVNQGEHLEPEDDGVRLPRRRDEHCDQGIMCRATRGT